MPKIRDLGINVIPETMRPPEIGPGGGGGGCHPATYGTDCPTTSIPTTINWPTTTIPTTPPCGPSLCPTTSVPTTAYAAYGYGYTCPGTTIPTPSNTCYGNYAAATPPLPGCPGTSFTTGPQLYAQHGCPGTSFPTTPPANYAEYGCPGTSVIQQSNTCPQQQQQGLSREAINQLKQQLQRQITWLDEYAKSVGPKTIEEIDAREKQIREELEDLERRRKEYQPNK